MDVVLTLIMSIALGLFVGVFSGMLGIGGGTVLVPAFRLLFGLDPLESTATSLFTIIPTSLSGTISHLRHKTIHIPLGLCMGIAGGCTSWIGVLLAGISPGWLVMVCAAVIIGYSAFNMFQKARKMKLINSKSEIKSKTETEIESNTKAPRDLNMRTLLIGAAIGVFAGLVSGFIGVGGGFIMVPLMVAFFNMPLKSASGTSLVAIIILAIPAVVQQAMLGNVIYLTGFLVVIGSIPGAVFGAKLVQVTPERRLRFIFGGFLMLAAALLALNELNVLG